MILEKMRPYSPVTLIFSKINPDADDAAGPPLPSPERSAGWTLR
jgi:hypothetical protein